MKNKVVQDIMVPVDEYPCIPDTLTIGDATPVLETDTGTPQLIFPVTLDNPVDANVSVNFETQDGTATTADNDYVATSGILTINAGDLSGEIRVDVNGDDKVELDETVGEGA